MAGARNPWEENYSTEGNSEGGGNPWEQTYQEPEKPKDPGILRKAGDLGLSVAKGIVAVPEAAVGLADIPTGGRVGKFLENEDGAFGFRPKQAKDYLSSFQSDDLQAKQKQFQDADGVLDKAGVALSNPSLLANTVAESVPSIGAGGVAARGLLAAAPRIGAVAASALGEGAVGAGSAASNVRQETEDGLLTAKQSGLAAATGAATALFGFAGGKIAQRMGIGDVDTMLAQGAAKTAGVPSAKSIPRQVVEGAISEGWLEELPQSVAEQILQNLALNKPWSEGVEDAAVMGTLAGMAMGGTAAGVSGFKSEPGAEPPPAAPTEQPPAQPTQGGPLLALPAPDRGVIEVGADGTARTPAYQTPGYVGDAAVTDVVPKMVDPVREQVAAAAEQGGALSGAALTAIDSGAAQTMQPQVPDAPPVAPISLEEADARDQAAYEQFFASADAEPVVGRYFENDDDIPDFDAASNVSDEEFLRALGATDEDIQDAIATTRQPASPQSSPAVNAGAQANEPAGPREGAGGNQAAPGQGQVALRQPENFTGTPTATMGRQGATARPGPGFGLKDALAQIRTKKQQEAANAQATAPQAAPASAPVPTAGTGAVEAAGVKPAGQRQLSADEQAAQDREEARAKELSLPPVLSARLQEAHKAHGRDVKRSVVERSIANEKANNTGTPKAKRERADRIARLEADLALFDEAAAMPPKEAAGLTENKVGRKDSAQIAQPESVVGGVQHRAAPSAITPTTTQGNADGPQASQAQQAATQPAQAGAATAAEPAASATGATTPAGTSTVRALNDGPPAENPRAQAAPATGAQGAAPAEPEFTTIKTVYGDSVTVRTADLNGNKQRLRQYTKDGKSKAVPAIHRDNLDLTGDKRKASAKEDANNPFFNIITTKDGSTFASQAAASRELNRLAMGETHEVVAASDVQDGAQGFVIQRKLDAPVAERAAPKPDSTVTTMRSLAQQFRDRHAVTKKDTDRTFAGVLDQFAQDVEQGKRTPQSVQQAIERYQELAAEPFQATQTAPATHADPGQAPEVATPAVVAQSVQKAARNEDTKPSEMRKWLVAEIDKELLQAPDRPDYDEAVKRLGEKDAISGYTGNGPLGKNNETGYITFDVPGDGKFKVRNSVRGLLEFRKNVTASHGFKDGGQKRVKPEQNDGVQGGSGGSMTAIANMVEEGDFEAARDYAEAVGIKLEDVKVPRGDMKPAWEKYLKDGTLPPPPDTKPQPAPKTAAQVDEEKRQAAEAEAKKPKDTGWNMAGTGYGGKRYTGRNITLDDGREVVARVYENAGNYDEVEVKVDGVRKFTVRDSYNAQDKADAFIKTLTASEPEVDYKGFERVPKGNGAFELRDGNMTVLVEPTERGKFQASFRGAKSSPHLMGEQSAVDWAANYREDGSKPNRAPARVTPQISGNPEKFIKVAADSVRELRSVDVDRVLTETPVQFRAEVAGYIKDRRKDLADEVDDVMADLRGGDAAQQSDAYQSAYDTEVERMRELADKKGVPASGINDDLSASLASLIIGRGFDQSIDEFLSANPTRKGRRDAMVAWRNGQIDHKPGQSEWAKRREKAQPAAESETPKLTQAEAKDLMEWQDLGQKNGIKTHILTFYESKADKDAKRGRMIVARVTKEVDSSNWTVEGTGEKLAVLAMAKKKAEQVGMEKAVADGFVEEVNPFAEYDAVAKQYGYEVRPDGMIGSDGKFPGPKMAVQRGRLRVESGAGNLLGSYAATPASIGKFLEAFWYAEKSSAPEQQEAKNPARVAADGFVEQGDAPMFSRAPAGGQTGTPAFKRWFGDSKVVDAEGKPLVVYHGTHSSFTEFKPNDALGGGMFFSPSPEEAGAFTGATGSNIMPVYLSAQKVWPKIVRSYDEVKAIRAAKSKGYDAIRVRDDQNGVVNWVVFDPTQVKSATGNSGQFDQSNPDIRFSFAGARAATADKHALVTAQDRLSAGEDAESVRQETGWFKGADGKWRFEIDDSRAFLKGTGTFGDVVMARMAALEKGGERQSGDPVRLGDVLRHESLFAAYPALRDIEVQFTRRGDTAKGRLATDDAGVQAIHVRYELDDKEALSVLLHEIQHGIQTIEGFATGGTPQSVASILEKERFETMANKDDALTAEFDALKRQYAGVPESEIPQEVANRVRQLRSEINAIRNTGWREASNPFARRQPTPEELFAGYTRLAGEVEARNTQARQKLTAEQRRATSPGQTADVADADVIVVFNGKEMANAPMPANAAPDAATTAQPLRTPAATIRAAITKAYGKLLGQLESKGLVTLTQTEDEAIEAAAQARAAKTGGDVAQIRQSLMAAVKRSIASDGDVSEQIYQEIAADEDVIDALELWMVDGKEPDSETNRKLLSYMGRMPAIPADSYLTFYRGQPVGVRPHKRGWASWTTSRDTTRNFIGRNGEVLERKGVQGVSLEQIALWRTRLTGELHDYGSQGEWIVLNDSAFGASPSTIDIRRSANGAVQGFFDPQTGQSFLIADNLTAEAAPGVLMHEVGIHMAADGSMKALFNRAAMMLKLQRGNPFIKAVQARMDAAGETSGEEAAAYIAEAYENDRANAPASVQRWLADLLAAVKAWMFKKGIMGANRLTVADVAAVARANARSMARGYVTRSKETGAQSLERAMAAFSRDTNTAMTNNDVVGNQGGRSADDISLGAGTALPKEMTDRGVTMFDGLRTKEGNDIAQAFLNEFNSQPLVTEADDFFGDPAKDRPYYERFSAASYSDSQQMTVAQAIEAFRDGESITPKKALFIADLIQLSDAIHDANAKIYSLMPDGFKNSDVAQEDFGSVSQASNFDPKSEYVASPLKSKIPESKISESDPNYSIERLKELDSGKPEQYRRRPIPSSEIAERFLKDPTALIRQMVELTGFVRDSNEASYSTFIENYSPEALKKEREKEAKRLADYAIANAIFGKKPNESTAPDSGGAAFSRTPGDQTQTENFRRWFKGSKAVDADGRPGRDTNAGMATNEVVGKNQGGRSADDISPGASFDAQAAFEKHGGTGDIDESTDITAKSQAFADMAEAEGYTVIGRGDKYVTIKKSFGQDADGYAKTAIIKVRISDHSNVNRGNHFGETDINIAPDDGYSRDTFADALRKIQSAYVNDDLDTVIPSEPTASGLSDAANPDIRFSRTASPSQPAAWDAPTPTGFDDVIYKLQDKNIDLKRVVEAITKSVGQVSDSINAYLKEELFHKRAAKRVADFGARELKPLMNQMRLAGLSMEDVEEYLHARHAKEANAVIAQRNPGNAGLQDGGSGMTNAAADNYFAKLDPAQRRKLESVAAKVDAIIADTRKLYVDYGLEDQAVVDGWANMYQHYIPLMREDKDGGMGTGQGFSVKGRETKGRTGSTRKVVDILANIASQREKLIVRGEKNRVTQALVGLAQANPNSEFWEVRSQAPTERVFDPKTGVVVERPDPLFKSRDNVVVAKVKDAKGNVTEQMVVFNEDNPRAVRMAAAMKNLDAGNLEGLLGMSAKITRYFSAINTQYNPVFGVVNMVRDVQGAMVNLAATPLAGQQGKIARDTVSALAGIYSDIRKTRKGGQASSKWAQLWEQMQDDGGTTGYRELFTNSADRANNLKSILNPEGWMDSKWGKVFTADGKLRVPMSMAQKGASEIFGWLSDYNEAMENGVRLAAYKAALDMKMSREQAASIAKNLTVNFNRKGQVGQQAGAVYAFFNAAMQGTARIGQTLFDMDGGDISTLRLSKTGKAVVYGGVTLGVMQALALAGAGFDEEDPPEFVRERSLIIPTGWTGIGPEKGYFSIPMPLGLHVIPGIGRHATEFALSGFDKPAKRALSVIGMFADAFNPIGNAGLSMQTLAPTALDPLVALTENKDWTGKPIARVSSNKALPGHTQWKDTATWYSKMAAEAINWVSGGNEYVAGALSPTPDQIDYLVAQVGGGVAREASKVFQAASTTVNGEELPTYKIPLLGRFAGNAASQASQGTAFYANLDRLNALETEIKGLRKDGRFDEAAKLVRENPQATMIAMANRAERDVQKLRRDKRELIAKDASREEVRAKEDQITAVMMRLNEAAERRKALATQ